MSVFLRIARRFGIRANPGFNSLFVRNIITFNYPFRRLMQAYIAVSYNKRKELQPVLDTIREALITQSITPLLFAELYIFNPSEEREMMRQAFAAIDSCDFLIAEVSDKAIGVGIETGYAKAKNKKIIYLRHKQAEHSTTLSGTADRAVIYTGTEDLKKQLAAILKEFALT